MMGKVGSKEHNADKKDTHQILSKLGNEKKIFYLKLGSMSIKKQIYNDCTSQDK